MGGHSGHWCSRTQAGLGRAERLQELPILELVEAAEPSNLTADCLQPHLKWTACSGLVPQWYRSEHCSALTTKQTRRAPRVQRNVCNATFSGGACLRERLPSDFVVDAQARLEVLRVVGCSAAIVSAECRLTLAQSEHTALHCIGRIAQHSGRHRSHCCLAVSPTG